MKKQFIYLFKHKGITGINIGRTSGKSVNARFNSFKVHSPCGSEIIGFFECDNCVLLEKKIHEELHANRMNSEFFDISVEHALFIINQYDQSLKKIKNLFNEWISNPENNIDALTKMMKAANNAKNPNIVKEETKEYMDVQKHFELGDTFLTTTQIMEYLSIKTNKKYNINFIGAALKKLMFEKVKEKRVYGYPVNYKL